MHYILQKNLYNEVGYKDLIEALIELNLTFSVVSPIPFTDQISPELNVEGPVVCFGATAMMKRAKKFGWTPGFWSVDHLSMDVCQQILGEQMLNGDGWTTTLGELRQQIIDRPLFIRPTTDGKLFAGGTMDPNKIKDWLEHTNKYGEQVNMDTPVFVAPIKEIEAEYRFFVIGSTIVGSRYKQWDQVYQASLTEMEEENLTAFVRSIIKMPDLESVLPPAFVIDVAMLPQADTGYKVVEFNCMNCCGMYRCDPMKIIMAVEDELQ